MEAITYQALGKIQKSSIAVPTPEGNEVVLRVHASGVCHTDTDILYGRYGSSCFPIVPGHEYAGEIVSVGSSVNGFSIGDRVVVDPNFDCGTCRACKKGLANLCENLGAYGVTRNGGFAEFSVVRQENVVAIGDLSYEVAALAEPVGCVLNGLDAVETKRAENALIFGAGPIGLLMALALRTKGVEDISVVDLEESRLELAKSFGFTAVEANSNELSNYQMGVDLVIDATGVPSVAEELINYTANGGSVLFFGVCPPDAKITVSPHEVFRRQIRLAGAHSLNHNIPAALDAIKKIGPEISRLISHRVPLPEIGPFLSGKTSANSLKVLAVARDDQ